MRFFRYLYITEHSYSGNIGFEEMYKFYTKATPEQEEKMEELIKRKDWNGFRKLIKMILGIDLK
jgi:hypothetical protein